VKVVVVGAGAWGLPTAAELARRGHDVIIVDRHGPGNTLSSSSGPTRLWRVADPDAAAIRLGRRAQDAMARLDGRLGRRVHTSSGLLWRDADPALRLIADAVVSEGVDHTEIPATAVGEVFPRLQADGRDALWFPEAGSLLAAEAIAGYLRLFGQGGGRTLFGATVSSVATTPYGVRITLTDGDPLVADAAVLCAGPGTAGLRDDLGLSIPLHTYLEQVVHVGFTARPHAEDATPCLFDGPGEHGAGIYCMPTPGVGYKVGLDSPLRELLPGDDDRQPDPGRTEAILQRVGSVLPVPGLQLVDEFVCCWTDSPDGWFIVDRDESLVVACGDSGKGFKYSPVMGEILADLVEGGAPDADVDAMSRRRFEGRHLDPHAPPTSLGGPPTTGVRTR
jgi:glycine/D-amino acid oxidase-like deaminating enzyme